METKKVNKKHIGGRKPKQTPSNYRYTVNMNDDERVRFEAMLAETGMNISKFISSAIFKREIKVVKIDKATTDYYILLTNFYNQFQAIGNNYNQTVRAIKTNFGDKRALALLYKLEKATFELVILSKQIIQLTNEFERRHLQK